MKTQGRDLDEAAAARVRAVRLVCEDGWSPADVATALGCTPRAVQLWCQKSDRGRNLDALRTKTAPGAVPKLTAKQRTRLIQLLTAGPEAAGFPSPLWTGPRVAELIRRTFGVTYCENYMPQFLRALGFTPQWPRTRPKERDQTQIDAWTSTTWPALKKSSPARRDPGVSR
jgi:transposase